MGKQQFNASGPNLVPQICMCVRLTGRQTPTYCLYMFYFLLITHSTGFVCFYHLRHCFVTWVFTDQAFPKQRNCVDLPFGWLFSQHVIRQQNIGTAMAHQLYVLQVLLMNLHEERMKAPVDPHDQVKERRVKGCSWGGGGRGECLVTFFPH